MLIKPKELSEILGVSPHGILHVGAHTAEEAVLYKEEGFLNNGKAIWVEAQPELAEKLRQSLNSDEHEVIEAVAWSEDGLLMPFHMTSNSQSSSVYDLGEHSIVYPDIQVVKVNQVITSRLDNVLAKDSKFEFLNLDIQGAELQALIGLGDFLNRVNYIYLEVSNKALYKGAPKSQDLREFLKKSGFIHVHTRWVPRKGWGDSFWMRKSKFPRFFVLRKLHLFVNSLIYYFNYFARAICRHRVLHS